MRKSATPDGPTAVPEPAQPQTRPSPVTSMSSPLATALDAAITQDGTSLLALSRKSPVLLIFLRHFG